MRIGIVTKQLYHLRKELEETTNAFGYLRLLKDIWGSRYAGDAKTLESMMEEMLDMLHDRESKVIRMRFGLGMKPHTMEEASKSLGVTRERIRQIEGKAIRKIRLPMRRYIFRGIKSIDKR